MARLYVFYDFMLRCLKQALEEMKESGQKSNQKSNQKIISAMQKNPMVTIRELREITGLSESGVKKIIRQLKAEGILSHKGNDKAGIWVVSEK
mgnify:CR=1 FL=1